jgi:hypothetical protein
MSRTFNPITANVLGLITLVWLVSGVVPSVLGVGGPPKNDPPNGLSQSEYPYLDYALHDNNLLWTVINNDGIIGNFFGYDFKGQNKVGPTLYYPRYSRRQYGY